MASETFKARPLGGFTKAALVASPLLVLGAMASIPLLFSVPLQRMPLGAKIQIAFIPIVFAISAVLLLHFRERARLVLDDAGLRMEPGLPPWIASAGWSIPWNEVAKVRTLPPAGVIQLQRRGSRVFRPLRVHDWVRVGDPVPPSKLLLRAADMKQAPLWQALERRGLFAPAKMPPGAGDFDLAQHPATRAALGIMAALMLYAAADFFLARERWAVLEASIFAVPGAIGAAAALVAWLLLRNADRPAKIPAEVSGPVSLVLGLAVACAAFYGLLRLNQWAVPLEAHDYVRNASCNALDPVEPGLPSIEYDTPATSYLCSLPREKRQAVLLRRGLGGMYQVDLTEQTRAIREFHARTAAAAQPR